MRYTTRSHTRHQKQAASAQCGVWAVQAGNKGHSATGAAPWALRERRAAGAAWGGGNAPGEAAWVSAGLKGAFKASLCER